MRILIGAMALLLSFSAWAQTDEEKIYFYASYFNCDPVGEDAADKTFEKYFKPAYEAGMKSGDITGWGYLKHMTGGNWRRINYHMGNSVVGVLNAVEKQGEIVDKALKPRDNDFGRACRSHDDYVWEVKGGTVGADRGKVGLSVYFVCDLNSESRADELVEKVFAPAYDAHMGPGMLTSWGWSSHVLGGKFRRLLTTTAASIDDLFKARADLLSGFSGSAAGREFNSICSSHEDYLWNIEMEARQN
ncbi:MAG: hypothetical protein OEQ74_05335 [Gammaproteobacteria bacterium]|nr:hypothetical protein [Gammaproteobacteria bacterium]